MDSGKYSLVSPVINRVGDKTMDNFKEISNQRVTSSLIIRDLTDDVIILSKTIKNIAPIKKEDTNE